MTRISFCPSLRISPFEHNENQYRRVGGLLPPKRIRRIHHPSQMDFTLYGPASPTVIYIRTANFMNLHDSFHDFKGIISCALRISSSATALLPLAQHKKGEKPLRSSSFSYRIFFVVITSAITLKHKRFITVKICVFL